MSVTVNSSGLPPLAFRFKVECTPYIDDVLYRDLNCMYVIHSASAKR